MFGFRERRRRRWRSEPTPDAWREILERDVPYFGLLDEKEQEELLREMHVFLHEKRVVGCGGLEVTDEMRVTIAAEACILCLGRASECYESLRTILLYPHPYKAPVQHQLPDGSVIESEEGRLGESWRRGFVVLAWDAVRNGALDVHDGHNVVLHEFAHQLDAEFGALEGTPRLESRAAYAAWAGVMRKEYAHLLQDVEAHHKTVMDRYGATNPAEFFAVATEVFFEKPIPLKRRHPELYDILSRFYGQDPSARFLRH